MPTVYNGLQYLVAPLERWEDRPMTDDLVPGMFVRHPSQPDWGIGQVQSVIGHRVTVNFEHVGKLLINGEIVKLEVIDEDAV